MKNEILEQKIQKTLELFRVQLEKSHTRGLILGISGGIDSAVVGFLIKMAFPDNSLGVIMPIRSSQKDMEHAKELVEKANLTHITLDLTQAHSLMLSTVKETMQDTWREDFARIADANTRARLRMTGLYTIANNLGYLVVGTDNAAEIYTGYFTKYGDGGVDVLPIAHLKKSEVYEWAEYLGVPQSILDKAPSADLWEGQTDEIEMGTTYRCIDAFLDGQEIPDKDREVIERLHRNSEHKRHTATVPPKF